jgi:hypothetical protein
MHPVDSTDYDTDNLLQDYIFKCLTGRLRTEVTEEFYELPDDEQGAPSLIYMALTKLHSHSRACVQTLQGSITNFKLSEIANEDVSLACSFLKSIAKHLHITNDIPSQTIGSILDGMATSQSQTFNSFVSVLELTHCKPRGISRTSFAGTSNLYFNIKTVLEQCSDKYRELLQGRRWPQAKLASSTSRNDSAFVAAPAPSPASKSSTVQRLYDSVPTEELLALLLDRNGNRRFNDGKCFNPLCNSDKHQVKDCPGPFPQNWDHGGRGRSRSRGRSESRPRDRSTDRGRGRSRSRSTDHRSNRRRDATPGLRKNSSVSFENKSQRAYKASINRDDEDDSDSVGSAYNPDMGSAFLLRQSKE